MRALRARQRVSLRLKVTVHRAAPSPGELRLFIPATDGCDTVHKSSPAWPLAGRGCSRCNWPRPGGRVTRMIRDRSVIVTGPCRRLHRRHRARRFRPFRPPPGTRGSLDTLSGIPRRPSPPEPAGGVALMRASNPAIRPFGCRSLGRAQRIDRAARCRQPFSSGNLLPEPEQYRHAGS